MNLDKHTFGKTPASIYLVDRLNFLNDPKYTRKISARIHSIQSIIADATRAAEAGMLNTKTLIFISEHLRIDVEDIKDNFLHEEKYIGSGGCEMPDELSINLMSNILIGELKSVSRRCREATLLKTKQKRLIGKIIRDKKINKVISIKPITIADVKDPTTPEILINRSRAKLERKGFINSLYGALGEP